MDDVGTLGLRVMLGLCAVWAIILLVAGLSGPLEGGRMVIFYIAGAALFGFGFLTAIRYRMSF